MKRRILFVLVSIVITHCVQAKDIIYVSPKGNDSSIGTIKSPLRTVEKAFLKAKDLKTDTIEIILREGEYNASSTIEINHADWYDKHILLKAYSNEKVSISGGKSIHPSKAKKVTDKKSINRIQKEHLNNIRVIDLEKENIAVADLIPVGFSRPSLSSWTELFVNTEPMQLSRWPNDSVQLIGKIHNEGNIPRERKYENGDAVFEYNTSRPSRWLDAPQVWISGYFAYGYAEDMIRVAEIDTLANTIRTKDDTVYGFKTGESFRTWHAVNLLEEIDAPGEYVIEATSKKIYFYVPEEKINRLDISILEGPIVAIENTGNVTIENITFEYSRGMGVYMENTENVLVKGCTFRNLGSSAVSIGRGDLPIDEFGYVLNAEMGGSSASRILGSINGRLYDDILYNRNGGKNNGVKDCYIYNVGAGGVSLGGGDRETLTPAGNFVENCRIHDFNRINRSYHGGVTIDGVGNRISNCEIYNAPSMAILLHGNDHVIEYCDIHDVCLDVDDQGAIYYGRDVSERGHVIQHCYFHNFPTKHRVSATYHDDGACGSLVYGCIYYNAGSMPVLIGGGHDHHYINNIFIESPIAIHIDNRMQGWGANMVAKDGILEQRLKTVDFKNPPYSARYPEIVNFLDENPSLPKRNYFSKNLFYKVDNILSGRTAWGEFDNNWITTIDSPGFVDDKDPLKGFRNNAKVYDKINNFDEIPFNKIGCTLPLLNQ